MGQKVRPTGFRIGINQDWKGKWYRNSRDYADTLLKDISIREYLMKRLKEAAVADIVIERTAKRINVRIKTAKPGIIIGQGGKEIEKLRKEVKRKVREDIYIQIVEIKNPDLNAQLVADSIANQIENRASFKNAQKRAIRNVMKAGAKGVKTKVSGRLGGAEIARSEGYKEGVIPLHTIRADVDYALSEAKTTYGIIGVKVWIYKGEILGKPDFELEDTNRDRNKNKNRNNNSKGNGVFKEKQNSNRKDVKEAKSDVDAKKD